MFAARFEKLGHRFHDGRWGVRGIDLSIRSGNLTVVAGPNGAGKSVLMKHLAGLLEPSEGRVLVGDEEALDRRGRPLGAAKVGYVFQSAEAQMLGDTALDDARLGPANQGLPWPEVERRARDALGRCGLAGRENDLAFSFSGGEARRLAIAAVLAMEPSILVLDEPFANLDRAGVVQVVRLVRDLLEGGTTVVLLTHEIEKVLGLASRLVVLVGGSVAFDGSPSDGIAAGVGRWGLANPLAVPRRLEDLAWLD
ncbi:MAG: ABC transporter ATP-binding protein [Spirochaetales bacterium]|nr:ABC transporter ATP-binding protein [Spirochaetales bacterium]